MTDALSGKMADLLAAAALMVAVVTVLYGLWYPEVIKTLEITIPPNPADRRLPRRQVRSCFRGRMLPLTILSVCVALVFFPDALAIVKESFQLVFGPGHGAVVYDSQKAAICVVVAFSVAMACHIFTLAVRMWLLLIELS